MSLFSKPTIYVSHAIRGTNGDMEGNCAKAVKCVAKLRALFPEINFYLPADSDLVLQILFNSKKLSEKDILWADLEILKNCHGWIFLHFDESKGSEIERAEAQRLELPMFDIVDRVDRMNYGRIRKRFLDIIEQTKKYYKENR